ncbi:MAG: alpha/beta hydrolase [Anaerolineae bacterium]|nr:alpha/beta hydrolase [Anaerolineae bacterium]
MSEWFSGDVVVNGIKIHYHRTGGDKPPVVLAHGITDNGLCWMRLAQALEDAYDLIMFDARGHGFSDAPGTGYAPEDHMADIVGLVDALGLERPALIGHSMGAADVALAVATYPDLARCAALEDPPWRNAHDAEEHAAMIDAWRASIIERKSWTRERLIAEVRASNPTWADADLGPWADAHLQVDPAVFGWGDAPSRRVPWQDLARKFACPVLLITGDPDLGAIVSPEVAREAAGLNPRLRVAHIPGAGHSIRREQFEEYVKVVREFLGAF